MGHNLLLRGGDETWTSESVDFYHASQQRDAPECVFDVCIQEQGEAETDWVIPYCERSQREFLELLVERRLT